MRRRPPPTTRACWSTWRSGTADGGDRRRGTFAAARARHRGTSIEELAEILDVEHIAEHLYTAGQPDPDLVIRTSGEQRIGGFLLWQTIHSEFYFCDAYWPAFRKVDFLRALRSYAARSAASGLMEQCWPGGDPPEPPECAPRPAVVLRRDTGHSSHHRARGPVRWAGNWRLPGGRTGRC